MNKSFRNIVISGVIAISLGAISTSVFAQRLYSTEIFYFATPSMKHMVGKSIRPCMGPAMNTGKETKYFKVGPQSRCVDPYNPTYYW